MMRAATAILIVAASMATAVWAQTDPAEITPYAQPKAPAEAAPADSLAPPPAAIVAVIVHSACGRCHGTDRPAVALSLRPRDFAEATIDVPSKEIPELKLVDTKDPDKSYLLMKVRGSEDAIGERMPLGAEALAETAIATIEAWVREVAAAAHADTGAVSEPEPPEVPDADARPPAEPEVPEAPEPAAEEAEGAS